MTTPTTAPRPLPFVALHLFRQLNAPAQAYIVEVMELFLTMGYQQAPPTTQPAAKGER